MGFLDKIKGKFLSEEQDNYADYPIEQDEDLSLMQSGVSRQGDTGMSISAVAIELKVVKPERYDNVTQIADHLLNHRTVVLNLEATNRETARRILDFLSGVAYSIDGQLKRVANNTFVITPHNVDVTGDQMRASETKSSAIHAEPVVSNLSSDTLT
ncbi:MAG: cell division protein SepF [Clostridia bacterium]|jgi:cell division inhibitor SepF|nr:cell division protein SepF [Clostridia bacterium]